MQKLFDLLDTKPTYEETMWMICAVTTTNKTITSSNINGYDKYGILSNYDENMSIVNRKSVGQDGISYSNVNIFIPRDANSAAFFSAFRVKTTFSSVTLIEVVTVSSGSSKAKLNITKQIEYKTCKIESCKMSLSQVEITLHYRERKDLLVKYMDGKKVGHYS